LVLSLSACGCSNSMPGETQIPATTLIPDILPTMDTNIPDPEVDTQMPIYTEGTDSTADTSSTFPSQSSESNRK
jgi:hypothetical protein